MGKMFSIASVTLIMSEQEIFGKLYSDEDIQALREGIPKAGGTEDEEEYSLIETIFDVNTKIRWETFVEVITTKGKWGFDPVGIREKVFMAGNVNVKHIVEL